MIQRGGYLVWQCRDIGTKLGLTTAVALVWHIGYARNPKIIHISDIPEPGSVPTIWVNVLALMVPD